MNAVRHLSIDIETYSDVDLGKEGAFADAPNPALFLPLFPHKPVV